MIYVMVNERDAGPFSKVYDGNIKEDKDENAKVMFK